MRERDRLVDDLRRTLRVKADGVAVPDREFEPTITTTASEPVRVRAHRATRWLVLVAAVLVTVVGIAAVVSRTSSSSKPDVHVLTPSTAPAPRARGAEVDSPVVAPTWVPPGEKLWSFETRRTTFDGSAFLTQLIGSAPVNGELDKAIFLEFQASESSPIPGDQTSLTVRGAPARVSAPKDSPAATSSVDWFESGTAITAVVRGFSIADAESLLNQLRPAGKILATTGFATESVPSPYRMLGEEAAATSAPNTTAVFGYWSQTPAPNRAPDIYVSTARRYAYPGFLRTAIGGTLDSADVAISYDPFQGGTVVLAARDGMQIAVSSQTALPRATLERIARSVATIDGSRASELRDQVDARVQSLPVLGRTSLPLGTITLRGAPSAVALCFAPKGESTSCASVPVSTDGAYGTADFGRIIAGAITPAGWIVYGTLPSQPSLRGATPQTGTIAGRKVFVALVPQSVNRVDLTIETGPHLPRVVAGFITRPADG